MNSAKVSSSKSSINRQKYLKNKKVAENNFKKVKSNEWEVTVIFYTALHLVEGTFPGGVKTENHRDRKALIEKLADMNNNYKKIRRAYKILYDYSIKARYVSIAILEEEVSKAKLCLKEIEENLKWAN